MKNTVPRICTPSSILSLFIPLGLLSLLRSPLLMKMMMWLKKEKELLAGEIKLMS